MSFSLNFWLAYWYQDRLYIDCSSRTDECILWLLTIICCENKCLRKLSIDDINHCEANIKSKGQTDWRNYLLEYLHSHSKHDDNGGYVTEFVVKGRKVCKEAWLLVHDIKKETFRRMYGQFQKGAVNVEHGHLGIKRPTEKTKDCIAWLEFFVNCVGQHQPDQKTIHLPSCFTILSIYKQMVQEHDSLGVTSVGLSQFYRIFNQNFPHVSLPKVTTVLYSVWLCIFTCIFFSPIKA